MRAPRRRHPGPGHAVPRARMLAVGAVLLLVAGCAAAPVPPAPIGADGGPDGGPSGAAAGGPPELALPPDPPSPTGPACGGPFDGASSGRVRLTADASGARVLGAPAAIGLVLLGDGAGCAEEVVVAPSDNPAARTLAATAAVLHGMPLVLLPDGAAEPDELSAPARIGLARALDRRGLVVRDAVRAPTPELQLNVLLDLHAASGATGAGPSAIALVAASDAAMQAELVARVSDGVWPLVVDASEDVPADVAAVMRTVGELTPDLVLRWAAGDARAEAALLGLGVAELGLERWTPVDAVGARELWLGDVDDPGLGLTAAVTAAARGAAFVAVDGAELRSGVERTTRMRMLAAAMPPDGAVVLVGGGADADWQLDTVLEGTPLPGGGFLPLEDRRIVALYGSPGAPALGLLGQQDLEATIELARERAAGYADAADGRLVVPGFDVIATVASSAPEPTGDYSRRIPIERLRPLVDRAGEEGMVVILDLQPGRTDFLTQAKEYEELLLFPHVHLALDPEWRIGPAERHLQRIGSVGAAEVQAVTDWLAALVRRERLPQKVLMLHQFVRPMLEDRDSVVIPPELIGVVHVDGQGPLPTKERTYAVMTDGAEGRWAWGWKNFTRIDVPMATPERTLDRTPVPVIVTYQ